MESHVLNTYHQARFRNIGHKRVKSISDSSASESSCNQNSPEYARNQPVYARNLHCSIRQPYVLKETGQYWNHNQQDSFDNSDEDDSDVEIVSITPTKNEHEVSSDEETQFGIIQNHCLINGTLGYNNLSDAEDTEISEDQTTETTVNNLLSEMEDTSLIEGTDYEIIHVYKIDPNLNVEGSSDEEEEQISSNTDEIDVVRIQHNHNINKTPNNFNLNIDSPVISNVDEYFMKENNTEQILQIKDGPVVNDVNEYFIQSTSAKSIDPIPINVDDFFNKPKSNVNELPLNIKSVPIVDEFFVQPSEVIVKPQENVANVIKSVPNVDEFFVQPTTVTVKPAENVADILQETAIEAQRQKIIEDIKRFLLEDPPETSSKTKAQRSCSFPPSPMRSFSPMDIDMKSSLTFEDLNIDLSDLTFENDKEKSYSIDNKNDDIPLALTDEDVNSFLITDKKSILQSTNVHGDDLTPQDMDFEKPVESPICLDNQRTSTPIVKSNVLGFCIEKPVKKAIDFKTEVDDFVDVESCNDTAVHVLEANNVHSLLEQFEATEKLNTKKTKRSEIKVEDQKKNGLTNGMRLQDAGVQLNKNKMRKILMPTTNSVIRRSPSPIHSDHDYCSPKKRYNVPNLKGGQSLLKPEVLSSNNRILNSRHRSCKNKKVVYQLSSDEESEICQNKKSGNRSDDSDVKSKKLKQSNKPIQICRKKLSPSHSVIDTSKVQSGKSVQISRKKFSPSYSVIDTCKEQPGKSVQMCGKKLSPSHSVIDTSKEQSGKSVQMCGKKLSPSHSVIDTSKKQSGKSVQMCGKKLSPSHSVIDTSKEQSGKSVQMCGKKLSPSHSVIDSSKEQSGKSVQMCGKKLSPSHSVIDTSKEQSSKFIQLCCKKLSPPHCVMDSSKDNSSVIAKNAFKASDKCSQPSNGSIKLTIKNKSEVILNCDDKDSQKISKNNEKSKSSSVNVKTGSSVKSKTEKSIKVLNSNKCKIVNSKDNVSNSVSIKEEYPKEDSKPDDYKADNFYTALFTNKQDVQMPQPIQSKSGKRSFEEEMRTIIDTPIKKEIEHPTKKRKLNLQEYKMRRGCSSNNSSPTVSPEAIFPDVNNLFDKHPIVNKTPPNGSSIEQKPVEVRTKIFDPIREASRKILMQSKKQKAMRMRDEDIVMSKIPKIELSQLQALMSDKMLNMVGIAPVETLPVPIKTEKPKLSVNYEEITLISIGTNTDGNVFKQMEKSVDKRKSTSPPVDSKAVINFKIKKSDHVLKQNVFDSMKRDKKSPVNDKKPEIKIDKERYKDITATLKRFGKQVDTKISSNTLFASIQDVVMKKAPEKVQKPENVERRSKSGSPAEKRDSISYVKTKIIREYDVNAEHGEDKIILHLDKKRIKPDASNIIVQTDSDYLQPLTEKTSETKHVKELRTNRKRNDSDMSLSSDISPVHAELKSMKTEINATEKKVPEKESRSKEKRSCSQEKRSRSKEKRSCSKEKRSRSKEKRSRSKEKRSRSKERRSRSRERYRRRSRSRSRSRRRRSHTRSRRSRSIDFYNRYKRSKSPYKRNRRSRSPYRSRRSPPVKRDYRSNRSRSKSRHTDKIREKSKSPVSKKEKSSPYNGTEKKVSPLRTSFTPPLRKPTVSESSSSTSYSSSTSTSSSSSSSSSTSQESQTSRRSTMYRNDPVQGKGYRNYYGSEDRKSNTPVEERRIVFVGKLEKTINKATLRSKFSKFGFIMEVRLHSKEDGTRYGFVTFQRAHDAWTAVESANQFPQYDVGFGGRRAFCRQSYADLDGLEAKYTENSFHGQLALPPRRNDDMSYQQMLLDWKKQLSQRKNDKNRADDAKP